MNTKTQMTAAFSRDVSAQTFLRRPPQPSTAKFQATKQEIRFLTGDQRKQKIRFTETRTVFQSATYTETATVKNIAFVGFQTTVLSTYEGTYPALHCPQWLQTATPQGVQQQEESLVKATVFTQTGSTAFGQFSYVLSGN
jgi:hypothetical protein